jgi:formate dehydrogenase subunit gamma
METLADIIASHQDREGPLLPILQGVQATFGHVSETVIREIADALNLTRAEVHGVVSFYHDFKTAPDPRPVVKICKAEACQARGMAKILPALEAAAGTRIKVETVYCLGLCSVGPAAMVGSQIHARLTASSIVQLANAL